ncbi:probable ATP-dependent helicase DinG homolog [Clavibacter sp.]|nr:probable ATP-dependent helicase DinG homolog [Clavibacter sp.]
MSAESVRKALAAAVEAIGGSQRAGQIAMAEAVANALEDRHHLLVQAGTGTGKSLAYLVPALVHGKRVLVATATLALQRQLIERDLPKVQKALEKELGRSITFAVYKGVGNYLCLQKMNADDSGVDSQVLVEISSLESDARRLRQWASRDGISGDRDDAPEVDRRVWLANSTSGRECVGADECRFGAQCFAVKAKTKAQSADIVVTNHTLLAIEIVDSHPILPERDAVILDEAHEFMDRTTQAVTEELTAARLVEQQICCENIFPEKLLKRWAKLAMGLAEHLMSMAKSFA